MSLNAGHLNEADSVPGAFPSEDAVMSAEQDTHNSETPTLTSTKATTSGNLDENKKEFLEDQEAAHTAGGQKTDKYSPGFEQNADGLGATSSQDKVLSSQEPNYSGLGDSTTGSRTAEAFNTGEQSSSAQDAGQNESSIGANLATMATAVGLAAKDALFAAKDSAVPAASAATEQAKSLAGYPQENAGPAASFGAERAGNEAAHTRDTATSGTSSGSKDTVPTDSALQTAGSAAEYAKDTAYSAANTAKSYAPNVLGEPSNTGSNPRDVASEDSLSKADKSFETTSAQPGESKDQLDDKSLGQSHTQEIKKPHVDLTSRVKGLEEQLAPDSMTPGVVTVLGTEQDRSFPLGVTDHAVST